MWAHDYDDVIGKKFKGNKKAMLGLTLGLKKEAFELRLISFSYTVDIFLVYKLNDEFQWNGYQGMRKLYRYLNSII